MLKFLLEQAWETLYGIVRSNASKYPWIHKTTYKIYEHYSLTYLTVQKATLWYQGGRDNLDINATVLSWKSVYHTTITSLTDFSRTCKHIKEYFQDFLVSCRQSLLFTLAYGKILIESRLPVVSITVWLKSPIWSLKSYWIVRVQSCFV